MKRITFPLTFLLFTCFSFQSFAQTTLEFDGVFQSIASFAAAPRTGSITLSDSKSYTMESAASSVGGNSVITRNGSGQIAYTMSNAHGHYSFKRTDGSEFQLNNINIEFNITNNTKAALSGFKDGNPVPGAVQNITYAQNVTQTVDVSSNTAFDDIDEFRIIFNYQTHPDNSATTLINSIQYSNAVSSTETRTIVNFETPTWADASSGLATISGGIFTDGDIKFTLSSGDFFITDNDGVGGTQSLFPTNYTNGEILTIESVSGNEFDFEQLFVKVYDNTLNANFLSAEGFKNTVSTGIQNSGTGFTAYSSEGSYIVTFSDGVFDDVDKVVITSGSNFGFSNNVIDNVVIGPVAPPSDTTPPVFESSTPSSSSITQTGFTLATEIDEAGTIYYVVVSDGAGIPTAANVKAGQASGGGSAVTSGNASVSSAGFSNNFTVTGLSAATSYDVYVVAEDDEGTPNLQASATRIDVTTLAPNSLMVAATVFLEGAYNGTDMNTTINSSIPTTQPYSINGHSGGSAGSIPAGAVDWVLVELREAGSAVAALNATKKGSTAGFLMSDGTIKATDGISNLTVSLSGNSGTDYFVVIYHRNHLPIMSASAVAGSGGTLTIDFTGNSANTHQTTTALVSIAGGKFAMPAGDADGDGDVDATDLATWQGQNGGVFSYNSTNGDFNLDGEINAVDRNDFQQKNTAKTRQVPTT